jgi:hypothetical protein
MQRYKGQLVGKGRTGKCSVEASPRGVWAIDEVDPSNLPEGDYALTFGDRHPDNLSGVSKRGRACLRRSGQWTVEQVRDS